MPIDMFSVTWPEGRGQGVQARDPVVVVLHRGEAQLGGQIGIVPVDAAHLVNGHLPLFELRGLLVRRRICASAVLAGLLLVGETGGVDGRETQQEILFARQLVVHRRDGVVAGLVVVALVADDGGELGIVLEPVLPVVVEKIVEGFAAVFKRELRRRLRLSLILGRELELL